MRSVFAIFFAVVCLWPTTVRATTWYSPTPITAGATIYASVQGGNQTVLVGGAGLIATSPNRKDWTRRISGVTVKLYGVAYGANRFVAVGEFGAILSSSDGVTWTAEKHPYVTSIAPDINGIIFAGGRFVAVSRSLSSSTSENIITSPDGRTWTRQTVDRGGYQLSFVSFANGQFVAGGGGILMVSSDATTWRTVWTGQTWLYAAARSSARWVAAGSDGITVTSADGNTWTQSELGQRSTVWALTYRDGRFLCVGTNSFVIPGNNASVFSSADGLTWTPQPFPETSSITRRDWLTSLLVTDTGVMAFGSGGLIAETTNGGAAWTLLSRPADRPHFSDVVYANGLFVAVADKSTNLPIQGINEGRIAAIYTSLDGWNWQEQSSGVRGSVLTKIAYGSGRFVAAGTAGVIVYSSDGVEWQRADHPVGASWQGIAYGAGRFVAVGAGTMTSTDGVKWDVQAGTSSANYYGVRFANGSFFLSTSPFSGPVLRSTDGVNWTSFTLSGSPSLNDIAFSNGLLVAATNGSATFEGNNFISTGALQTSTDGVLWTALRTPYLGAMRCVQRLSDRWVAATSEGAFLSSTDGRIWTPDERLTNNGIYGIAAAPDYAVAVGEFGTLLTTRDPKTLPPATRPLIAVSPVAQTISAGAQLRLTVSIIASPAPSFQWMKDGIAITGAVGSSYTVPAAMESDAGEYTVVATNSAGSVTTLPITVTILASRIANLSILSVLSVTSPELTVGFFASGTNKSLLVRAVGPALAQFGLIPLARPGLSIYSGQTPIAVNEGWDRAPNAPQISAAATRVGAFTLPPASEDSAALNSFANGSYSAIVRARNGPPTGSVLVEIYDADTSTGRLTNVSALAPVGPGANLVAGFVLSGNTSKRLLIRAIGPGLGAFGRTGVLADPQLSVIRAGSQTALTANDNWGGDQAMVATFFSVGAFNLANNSKDAAVVVSLEPGAYTVQVSGVGATSGDALVEVYELP